MCTRGLLVLSLALSPPPLSDTDTDTDIHPDPETLSQRSVYSVCDRSMFTLPTANPAQPRAETI
jgi:hypothetical protein